VLAEPIKDLQKVIQSQATQAVNDGGKALKDLNNPD